MLPNVISPVPNVAGIAVEVQKSGCAPRCVSRLADKEHVQLCAIPALEKSRKCFFYVNHLAFMKRLSKGKLKIAGVGTKTRECGGCSG